jgi:hypothetical protein
MLPRGGLRRSGLGGLSAEIQLEEMGTAPQLEERMITGGRAGDGQSRRYEWKSAGAGEEERKSNTR